MNDVCRKLKSSLVTDQAGRFVACCRVRPLSCLLNSAILIATCLVASAATGQNFSVEHWTTRNGLRTSVVASITQTREGNLWVGTRNGLARYDGLEFKMFTPRNLAGLSSQYINYVVTGPDATLYVGTDDRLCISRRGHWRSFAVQRGNLPAKVFIVLPVGDNEAWIGTSTGVLFHYKNDDLKQEGSYFPPDAAISGLARTPDGTLWLATSLGLFSLSQGQLAPYRPSVPLPAKAFYDLSVSSDGTLFAASDVGLFGIRGDQWKKWDKTNGLPSDELNVLTTDAQGVLWIGTAAGLARMDNGAVRRVDSVSCSVHALFADSQRSLWIGCDNSVGLFRLRSHDFEYLSPHGTFESSSASLAIDSKGTVWIGSRQGLYRYTKEHFQLYNRRDGLPSDVVWNVSVGRNDVVWVATADGLARIENGHIIPVRDIENGLSGSFFSVRETFDGTLWAQTDQGLKRRLPGQAKMALEPGLTPFIESIYQDPAGSLWVSTDIHGLVHFTNGAEKVFLKECGLGSNTVYGSVQDNSGVLWAWTYDGLSRIRGDKCANIPPDAGLPSGQPGSITYDGAGNLWLRTQDGVAAINIAEANKVIDNPGPLTQTRLIGSDEGLDSSLNDLEVLSVMVKRDSSQVWIPTSAGIAVVDTSTVKRPIGLMRPQITSFVSDSGQHDISAPVQLQPGDLHLQFSYKVPSLLAEPGRIYRYRLTGFDKDWREGQENGDATYTSIPAGKYKFLVSSRQPFEPWLAVSNPVEFTVLPRFYQTWWWYTLVLILGAVAIWTAYWFRLLTLRRQYAAVFAERDSERSRLARELHDTLSRGMMAIHMQLQLARAYLPAKPETACTHLDAAVGIVRDSASETRKSIAALRSAEEDASTLRDTLERAASTFRTTSDISLDFNVQPNLPSLAADVNHEIARIVSEALSNVHRHSGAQQVVLSMRVSNGVLQTEIADDGVGFDPGVSGLEHFGIQGMTERAKRIHASLSINSVVNSGTVIVLEIPLQSPPGSWRKFLELIKLKRADRM